MRPRTTQDDQRRCPPPHGGNRSADARRTVPPASADVSSIQRCIGSMSRRRLAMRTRRRSTSRPTGSSRLHISARTRRTRWTGRRARRFAVRTKRRHRHSRTRRRVLFPRRWSDRLRSSASTRSTGLGRHHPRTSIATCDLCRSTGGAFRSDRRRAGPMRSSGENEIAVTAASMPGTSFHVSPPSSVTKRPWRAAAANTTRHDSGETATSVMSRFREPRSSRVHDDPSSVDR